MKKAKKISIEELNILSHKKDIWCIGCGKRFHDIIHNYKNEAFVEKITMLVDNNVALQGKYVDLGNHTLYIRNGKVLNYINSKKEILLITSDAVESIYNFGKVILSEEVDVFLYPKYYRKSTSIWLKIFSKFLTRKRIIFHAGSEPHENADEIVDCILNNCKFRNFQPIYIGKSGKNVKTILKEDITQKNSFFRMLRFCYYYGTSKYLCYENEMLEKVSSEQKLIFLNHGTIPLKRVDDVLKQNEKLDYALCPSLGCADFYEKQYGIPRNKHLYVMPARINGLFVNNKNNPWKKNEESLIVWLPTFRQLSGSLRNDSKTSSAFNIIPNNAEWYNLNSLLKRLNQRLLIKRHPRDRADILINIKMSNIQLITDQDLERYELSLNNLLAGADVLLTDYSGIAFEYMLLDRPIGYIIQDIREYHRGFSVTDPLEYMPGVKIERYSDLCSFFETFKNVDKKFSASRHALVKKIFQNNVDKNGALALLDIIRKEFI